MQPSRMDRNRTGSAAVYTIGLTNAGVGQNLRDRPSRDFKPRGILVPSGVRSWKAKLRTRRSSSFSVLYPMSLIAISRGDDWTSISGSSSGRREKDYGTWRETCSFRLLSVLGTAISFFALRRSSSLLIFSFGGLRFVAGFLLKRDGGLFRGSFMFAGGS